MQDSPLGRMPESILLDALLALEYEKKYLMLVEDMNSYAKVLALLLNLKHLKHTCLAYSEKRRNVGLRYHFQIHEEARNVPVSSHESKTLSNASIKIFKIST